MNTIQNIFNFYVEKSKSLKAMNPSLTEMKWEIELPFSQFENYDSSKVHYSKDRQQFMLLLTDYGNGCVCWFVSPKCVLIEENPTNLPKFKAL